MLLLAAVLFSVASAESPWAATINATTTAAGGCKAAPGQAGWPSAADWAALSRQVGNALLQPRPAAAPCHRNNPAYSATRCRAVTDAWRSSEFHANHPTSTLFSNANGYSCEPESGGVCGTAGFPIYVLNASSAAQIARVVKWAGERNVRVNVKSTGHDFLGRSTQPNSVSIWVHHLQSRQFHPSPFRPTGCPSSINTAAITAGGGTQMRKLTAFAHRYGRDVVVGASDTVSVGGYVSGGGHGVLSARFGLAADSVLQAEVVTPAGNVVIANECQNTDLFWAVRGGGGGTFGVVTKYTLAAFPSVGIATWSGVLAGPPGSNATWNAITAFHEQWARRLAPAGCTGYFYGRPAGTGRMRTEVHLAGASSATQLETLMRSVTSAVAGRGVTLAGVPTFRAARRGTAGGGSGAAANDGPNPSGTGSRAFPGNGQNKIVTSWLYGSRELLLPAATLRAALQGAVDGDTMLYQDFEGGAGTARPPMLRGGSSAVNPAWRRAVVRAAAELQWAGSNRAKLAQRKRDALRFGESLRRIAPDSGCYVNEADPDMRDSKTAFWGANYPRLLSIKLKYDPTFSFWCKSCVGSEYWRETQGGGLCQRQ